MYILFLEDNTSSPRLHDKSSRMCRLILRNVSSIATKALIQFSSDVTSSNGGARLCWKNPDTIHESYWSISLQKGILLTKKGFPSLRVTLMGHTAAWRKYVGRLIGCTAVRSWSIQYTWNLSNDSLDTTSLGLINLRQIHEKPQLVIEASNMRHTFALCLANLSIWSLVSRNAFTISLSSICSIENVKSKPISWSCRTRKQLLWNIFNRVINFVFWWYNKMEHYCSKN